MMSRLELVAKRPNADDGTKVEPKDRPASITLTEHEQAVLEATVTGERRPRNWRRYRAILLLAQGQPPSAVAAAIGCSLVDLNSWAVAWQTMGLAGLRERLGPGRAPLLTARAERLLETLLATNPQKHGYEENEWTLALLRAELERAGYPASTRTIQRAMRRLGWRWYAGFVFTYSA